MKKGFTLLEILLVIAAIGILAAVVIVAINPQRQLSQVRDSQRQSEVNTISKALNQYLIDTGSYPAGVEGYYQEVCRTGNEEVGGPTDCTGLLDLRPLVPTYIAAVPDDPQAAGTGTGYSVRRNPGNASVAVRSENVENQSVVGVNNDFVGVQSVPFGTNGVFTHHNAAGGNSFDWSYGSLTDEDGNIYITGGSDNASGWDDWVVWKVTPQGTLDTSFGGGNGFFVWSYASNSHDIGYKMLQDDEGNFYSVGYSYVGATNSYRVHAIKFDENGVFDTNYGSSGIATYLGRPAGFTYHMSANINPATGEIFAVRPDYDSGGNYWDMLITKFAADGSTDTSFGVGGEARFERSNFGTQYDIYGQDIVFQDGSLYISADVDDYSTSQASYMYIFKYSDQGVLDTSFGVTGPGYTRTQQQYDGPGTLLITSDNKILVNGQQYDGVRWQAAVWRFNIDGSPDTTFGVNGVWSDPDPTRNFWSQIDGSLLLLDDGSFLLSGEGRPSDTGDWYPILFRLNPNGGLDTNFGENGMVLNTAAPGAFASMSRNAVGDITIGGYSGGDMLVWKYE